MVLFFKLSIHYLIVLSLQLSAREFYLRCRLNKFARNLASRQCTSHQARMSGLLGIVKAAVRLFKICSEKV